MSPRFLSEPEAWREIARRLSDGEQADARLYEHRAPYLCWMIRNVADDDPDLSYQMRERIGRHNPDGGPAYGDYVDSGKPHPVQPRILAALFLALEAEDEIRDARRGAR